MPVEADAHEQQVGLAVTVIQLERRIFQGMLVSLHTKYLIDGHSKAENANHLNMSVHGELCIRYIHDTRTGTPLHTICSIRDRRHTLEGAVRFPSHCFDRYWTFMPFCLFHLSNANVWSLFPPFSFFFVA